MENKALSKAALAIDRQRQRIFNPVTRSFVAALNRQIKPILDKLRNGTLPQQITADEIDTKIKADPIKAAFVSLYVNRAEIFARQTFESLQERKSKADWISTTYERDMQAWINEGKGAELITAISETTKARMKVELSKVVADGAGARESAGIISREFTNINFQRGLTIARTEIGRAQALASYNGANMSGVDFIKEWSALNDGNTRDTHANLNGKTAEPKEKFLTTNGNSLRFPFDPKAPASETINCRCVVINVRRK